MKTLIKNRFFLLCVALWAGIALISPIVVGHQVAQQMRLYLGQSKLNHSPINLELIDYQRGYFKSRARLRLQLHLQGQLSVSEAIVLLEAKHSPLFLSGLKLLAWQAMTDNQASQFSTQIQGQLRITGKLQAQGFIHHPALSPLHLELDSHWFKPHSAFHLTFGKEIEASVFSPNSLPTLLTNLQHHSFPPPPAVFAGTQATLHIAANAPQKAKISLWLLLTLGKTVLKHSQQSNGALHLMLRITETDYRLNDHVIIR